MAVSLTKPAIGSTGWGQDVNDNFATIENGFNGDTEIGPLKLADGGWVGLGPSSERVAFADKELRYEVKGDGIHKFNSIIDMQMWPITNVDWMAVDTIYQVTPGERVNIPDGINFTDNEYIYTAAVDHLDYYAEAEHRFHIGGTEQLNLTDGKLAPTTDDDIALGDAGHRFSHVYIAGDKNVVFGPGGDIYGDAEGIGLYLSGATDIDLSCTNLKINAQTGWTGTFTNGDSDTVTVTDGIITGVA